MSLWVLTIGLLIVVGLLTGAATALRSVSRIWLRHWAEQRLAGAATAALYLERPHQLLVAAGTGIAATVFTLGAVIGLGFGAGAFSVSLRILLTALGLLILGQLLPRAIAKRWPAGTLAVLLPPLRVVERMVAPWAALATRLVDRRLPIPREEPTPQESLEDLLREGEVEGVGAAGERAIISGVVEFGTRLVREAMTPHEEIVGVERSADAATVARVVAQSKFSRLPVYRESLDQVEGLLTSWDIIARPETALHQLRPVAVASPDEPCHAVMTRMLRDRRHLAIVQGLAGETLGLVTLEDLIEEVVGDIHDEHDEPQAGER